MLVERRGTCVVGRELREPLTGLVAVGDHLVEASRRTCGRARRRCLAGLAPRSSRPGSSSMSSAVWRRSAAMSASSASSPCSLRSSVRERGAPYERRPCDSDRVGRSAVAGERVACLGRQLAMRDRVGQPILFGSSTSSSSAASSWADRARRPGTGAGRSRARAPVRRRQASASAASISATRASGLAQGRKVDAAEPVERGALARAAPSSDWWSCWPWRSTRRRPTPRGPPRSPGGRRR